MDRSKEKRKEERYKGRTARQEWQKERGQVQRSRRNEDKRAEGRKEGGMEGPTKVWMRNGRKELTFGSPLV